jgi:hypothetical protein
VEVPLLNPGDTPQTYEVRLSFAAPEGDKPGQRVFDVKLQGKTVAAGLDIAAKAGTQTAHVEVFENIPVTETLLLELVPAKADGPLPVINTLEVLRTGAEEIRDGVATSSLTPSCLIPPTTAACPASAPPRSQAKHCSNWAGFHNRLPHRQPWCRCSRGRNRHTRPCR